MVNKIKYSFVQFVVKLYKICTLLHRSELKLFDKFHYLLYQIVPVFVSIRYVTCFLILSLNYCDFFSEIHDVIMFHKEC